MSENISTKNKEEIIETDQKRVSCDGPEFSKHPRVYLSMTEDDTVVCPYCSRVYKYNKKAA